MGLRCCQAFVVLRSVKAKIVVSLVKKDVFCFIRYCFGRQPCVPSTRVDSFFRHCVMVGSRVFPGFLMRKQCRGCWVEALNLKVLGLALLR